MPKRYRAIAEYYDFEYAHHEMLREDVAFFQGHLPKRRQSILELGAGTGRAAIALASAGHHVVAVDHASDMLAIARRKWNALEAPAGRLTLHRADILRLKLNRRFDRVCLFFNTFLTFTALKDQDALLQAVRAHLKPRGRFWLDIFQPDLDLLSREVSCDLDPHTFFVPNLNRTVFQTTSVVCDTARQLQHMLLRYEWFDATGQRHDQSVEFDFTYLFPRELRLLLERNGLRIERMWGDYDGNAPTAESPRLIVQCCLKQPQRIQ